MDKIVLHILSDSNICNIDINDNNLLGINKENKIISTNNNNILQQNLGSFNKNSNHLLFKNNLKSWLKYDKKLELVKGIIISIGKNLLYVMQTSPFLILKDIKNNQKIKITKSKTIGRSKENDIVFNDSSVSKFHSKISFENNKYFISDNNSTNGLVVFPNKQSIPVAYDDVIQIGGIKINISKYKYGIFHDIGKRHTFEDTYQIINSLKLKKNFKNQLSYFAVFDGHSGTETSLYAKSFIHTEIQKELNKLTGNITDNKLKMAITKSILKVDKTIYKENIPSGTTANICIIFGNKLFTVNVGDSRAVLSRNGKAIPLSFDHKPNNKKEMERINNSNGFVMHNRVNGRLAVSRALGDNSLKDLDIKKSPVIAFPDITTHKLTSQDEFIILACDGLWDVMSNQNAIDFVRTRMNKNIDIQLISKEIVCYAIHTLDSTDNVTCLIVKL
tara:strand:+ start:155 stop:1492 length:1338 start_codon:yes stop_codon:yes gene_type:complete